MKPFYLVVENLGSKFAKTLQTKLSEYTDRRVLRTRKQKPNAFYVTQQPKDKIQQLTAFKENNVSCPNFVVDPARLTELNSKTTFARTLINSTGGRGIIEFSTNDETVPWAPLYTAYIPKKSEYRLHVFNGKVIDIQEKRKRHGVEERNTRVRNLANGYVYCRDNVTCPDSAADLAIMAVASLDYEYGAVDVIYNEHYNKCYVLEVNSRPGLMGTTLEKYAQAIREVYL